MGGTGFYTGHPYRGTQVKLATPIGPALAAGETTTGMSIPFPIFYPLLSHIGTLSHVPACSAQLPLIVSTLLPWVELTVNVTDPRLRPINDTAIRTMAYWTVFKDALNARRNRKA